jgi:hypothetical protein
MLKMIQGVGGCWLLEIWKQLQKFLNWWPEIVDPKTDGESTQVNQGIIH